MRGHVHFDLGTTLWAAASTLVVFKTIQLGGGWLAAHNVPGGALAAGLVSF